MTYWIYDSWRPGPDIGAGIRFFVTEWFSVRADIRQSAIFNGFPLVNDDWSVDGVMYLGLGASFNVGY